MLTTLIIHSMFCLMHLKVLCSGGFHFTLCIFLINLTSSRSKITCCWKKSTLDFSIWLLPSTVLTFFWFFVLFLCMINAARSFSACIFWLFLLFYHNLCAVFDCIWVVFSNSCFLSFCWPEFYGINCFFIYDLWESYGRSVVEDFALQWAWVGWWWWLFFFPSIGTPATICKSFF